jgi:hypothetical protein
MESLLRYDVPRVAKWLCAACIAFATPPIVLGLDDYVRATPNSLVVNRFWSVGERVYPYSSIKSIRQLTHDISVNGQAYRIAYFTITFDDASEWSTQEGIAWDTDRESFAADREFIEYVSRQSGVAILAQPTGQHR